MVIKKQDADPRIQLSSLKKTEEELLKKIKPKEKELRTLIEELKALRILIEATSKQVQSFKDELDEEIEKEILDKTRKEIESLETTVEDISVEIKKSGVENTSATYSSVSAQNIAVAASKNTINELYDLANKETWSEEDSKKFFNIQYNIKKTIAYQDEISPVFKDMIDDAYKALQTVHQKQEEQIKQNYSFSEQKFSGSEQYSVNNTNNIPKSFSFAENNTSQTYSSTNKNTGQAKENNNQQKNKKGSLDSVL